MMQDFNCPSRHPVNVVLASPLAGIFQSFADVPLSPFLQVVDLRIDNPVW